MCLPQRFWRASLSLIPSGGEESPQVNIKKYIKQIEELASEGIGLLVWGNVRGGKSSAAAVVAKEARRRGVSVYFIEAENLVSAVHDRELFDSDVSVKERAKAVSLLVLDDYGKEFRDQKGFAEKILESIVRYRVSNLKPTIITTNLTPEQLSNGGRASMMALMSETMIPVKMSGGSFLQEKVAELQEKLKE